MKRTILTSKTSHLIDTIHVMKKQESSGYLTKIGLYDQQQGTTTKATKKNVKIDGECRRLMVIWFKQLAEFIDMSHHTVAMAVNTLDRFVEREPHILLSSDDFQLAAIASLYTVVKTQELLALDPITMSKLCKGAISTDEIERMELDILTKLKWRMNAPTAMAFAEMYLKILFPSSSEEYSCCEEEEKNQTTTTTTTYSIHKKLIQCQLEYAMKDSRFLGMSAAGIAFTATHNAITVTTDDSFFSARLTGLKDSIATDLLPSILKDDLMDHMERSEPDTISSACNSQVTSTKKQQQQQLQFGWLSGLSGKSVCNYHSPRSITMSRE